MHRAPAEPPSRPGPPVEFSFDGEPIEAREYDTIASALWASGRVAFGKGRKLGTPRTLVCGEGWCWACSVTLDGVGDVLACVTPVRAGMVVRSLSGEL